MKEYTYICNVQYAHTHVFSEYCSTVYTLSELLKKYVINF